MLNSSNQYSGILIRATLDDKGMLPRSGTVSNSPDVIPFGTSKASNPESLFINSFDKNLSTSLTATKTNYVYIRGVNTSENFQQGNFYCYFALTSDLDNPSKWSSNQLKTEAGANFVKVTAQQQGSIVVTDDPFIWTPTSDEAGNDYSLVGIIVPIGHQPDFSSVSDFQKFVDENGNVGWNEVTIEKPTPPPTPPLVWSTSFDYVQTGEQTVSFTIFTNNIPLDSMVSFNSTVLSGSTGTPSIPIALDKTTVSNSPKFSTGIQSTVPNGYKCRITFYLYANNPPSGSTVEFMASYLPSGSGGPVAPVVLEEITTTN